MGVVHGVYNSLLKLVYNALLEVGFVVPALGSGATGGFTGLTRQDAACAGDAGAGDGGAGPHSDLLPQMMLDNAGVIVGSIFGTAPVVAVVDCL